MTLTALDTKPNPPSVLLSARFLVGVAGVNSFQYAERLSFTQGDTNTVYFQLLDLNLDTAAQGYSPPGRRYSAAAGATLTVLLDNLDTGRLVQKVATVPFAGDRSIWSFGVTATDQLVGTVALRLQLTEGSTVSNGVVSAGLSVYAKNS